MSKPYGFGLTVGRFQTFHNGHRDMIEKAVSLCEETGIFIGSSQESGTAKNPFSYGLRAEMIKAVFGDAVKVFPLPDIGVGNNCRWGDYVIQNAVLRFGRKPDLFVSGKEERRVDWFDGAEGLPVAELYVPKTVDISATAMRGFFVSGDRKSWESYTPCELWDRFDALRGAVISSLGRDETASL